MAEPISARDFVERELRANPDVSFAEVQERGRQMGLSIAPFLYGAARRAIGLPSRNDLNKPVGAGDLEAPVADEATDEIDAAIDTAEAPEDEAHLPVAQKEPKQKSPAFDFAIEQLRINPDLTFQDLKQRGAMAGLRVMPIVFGRAKALLGLVPVKPRQPRAKKVVEAPISLRQVESAAAMPRPKLPAAMPAIDGLGSLEQLITALRDLEAERQRLQDALAAIQACVDEALQEPEAG
jgi:hypothetical protein